VDAIIFELGGVTWPAIVSFVETFDPAASPPPVIFLTQLSANPAGSTTGYATSPAGDLGVACATGLPENPTITLAGPFPIGP
jgi:hypothetical protein